MGRLVPAYPQTVVRLAEQSQNPDGSFRIRVSFGDAAPYDVTVTDPADQADEARLAWYFEEHLRYPFLDKDLERDATGRIVGYGTALFQQVFGGLAGTGYRALRDRAFDGGRIEISGSAGLHLLHWEAMRDPDLSVPLAVRLPITRRVEAMRDPFDRPGPRPTLNILLVVARPNGPEDVGYRTISRPLLDALRTAGLPATVDLVRPGTWQALRDHLETATDKHGPGWYQVIHFDVHGAFSHYCALEQARREQRLRFAPGSWAPFDGRRGFLFFETAQEGQAGPVAAEEVASLLAEHGVPVAVLNACQSAMQDASEAGLAQRLAETGVPVAVGMAYSVTVSAAERAMPVLYGQIAGGANLAAAVHAARRCLHEDKARRAYFGQTLDLEDWMLPVIFAQQPLSVGLRPMTGPEQAEFDRYASVPGAEPVTEYGFVGRDLDIQAIERRILTGRDGHQLLVRGMAGAGKSTLLAHLAWWWQRTGLVERVFRFSYEDRAWTSAQIIREIRARLMSPAEQAQADSMTEQAQAEQVATLLRATRHLLILDNTESVTAAPAAIPHTLTPAGQVRLKAFLAQLRGGRTLVLLGSREPETWLTGGPGGPGTYELPGLDPQAASVLVERILARHRADRYLKEGTDRGALQELVTLLGGYPLSLTVVLPVLAAALPSAVLAELKAGGRGADPAGLIGRAIECSHGQLDPALQNSLLLLAPFTSVIGTGRMLERYRDRLLEHQAVRALGSVDLAAALDQAVSMGLATPHPQHGNLVQVQPVLPYFLRSRLHHQPAWQAAASQAHYLLYRDLAGELTDMLYAPGDPQPRLAAQGEIRAEYANLAAALDHGLRTAQPVAALIDALDTYLRQSRQHETRRQLLDDAIAAYLEPTAPDGQIELAFLHEFAGGAALGQHRLDVAEAHFKMAIGLLDQAGNRKRQSALYHQLARIAHDQKRYDQAEASYCRALDIDLAYGDQCSTAITHHQLGVLAQDEKRYDQAEASYRRALDIFLAHGDQHNAASTYGQLGVLAHDQKHYGQAQTSYRKALDIFLAYGDQHNAASTYGQLGVLAHDQKHYGQAQASYRKALDIFLAYGDQHNAASTYGHLGVLAHDQKHYGQAETSKRQARETHRVSDRRAASSIAARLGAVLAELGQHHEAVRILTHVAVVWHQETGQWTDEVLHGLQRERAVIGPGEFTGLLTADLPAAVAGDLIAAIEADRPLAPDGQDG